MRILLACEESQEVTKRLRAKGHEAFSCDILPCSGGKPEWHLQQDGYTSGTVKKLKIMIQGENQLTDEKKKLLKQGTKVEFKWHGSKSLYTGRIEVDKYDRIYFINEHCFENNKLKAVDEGMRYYNTLDSFFFFTHFEVLK